MKRDLSREQMKIGENLLEGSQQIQIQYLIEFSNHS